MMKKIITVLGLLLIPISFTSAGSSCIEFDIPDTFVLNKSTVLSFNNLNFSTNINNNNLEHIIYLTVPSSAASSLQSLRSIFGYYNGLPYLYAAYHQSNTSKDIYQGYATNVYVESIDTFDVSHITYNTTYENIDTFLNANGFNGGIVCATDGNSILNEPFIYCFKNSTNYYCFKVSAYGGDTAVSTFNTLSGSLGLTTNADLTNINSIEWSVSPFTESTTPTQPTQQYTCPTAQQLINTYPEQYNTGLCYSSNMIYSGGTIQTVTPKTIFELYPTRTNLNQDVQNYNAYCNNATTTQACQTIFEGKTEEYTIIAKIPQNVTPMQLYAYCNLTLNMDPNRTTCTTSTGGTINNGITMDDVIDNIGNSPITVISPGTPPEDEGNGTGSVFDKYTQQEEDTNRRNIIQKAEDTIQTMKEIYAKLTGIFRARQGNNGIIPPLITGLIALIVLYKLFKK